MERAKSQWPRADVLLIASFSRRQKHHAKTKKQNAAFQPR
jgi:hypothetical protein